MKILYAGMATDSEQGMQRALPGPAPRPLASAHPGYIARLRHPLVLTAPEEVEDADLRRLTDAAGDRGEGRVEEGGSDQAWPLPMEAQSRAVFWAARLRWRGTCGGLAEEQGPMTAQPPTIAPRHVGLQAMASLSSQTGGPPRR
jgi:hypothetical protein